jgi:hypothetical protein
VAAIVLACGSKESKFTDGPSSPGTFDDGSFANGEGGSGPDITKNDPFPPWCGPDAGAPPQIGGTEQCPDDKNLPGCGCDEPGKTAPCWTGLRKQRNLGVCKDGTTTCQPKNETLNVWGDCVGEVLPQPDGKGSAACGCFSVGTWSITNESPCIHEPSPGTYYAYSAVYDQSTQKTVNCGQLGPTDYVPQGTVPTGTWSPNTLKVDCAGTFTLCYKIRQGDFNNPQPTDCTLGQICTDAIDYVQANVEQKLPDLKTWAGGDPQCAFRWEDPSITPDDKSPGYGEMIVKGRSVHCDAIDDGAGNDFVFNRVEYCPRICRNNAHPEMEICQTCQLSGQGSFH